jgi:hypothetical protein
LTAIYLLRGGQECQIELEPSADVVGRTRYPDLRIRKGTSEPWLYVEVSQPDISEAEQELAAKREPLFSLLATMRNFALDIYLRRDPTEDEVQDILKRARELVLRDDKVVQDIGDLGSIFLNHNRPGMIVPIDPPGEPVRPVLGKARGIVGPGQPSRQVSVRIAYSDGRAEKCLYREAQQLPKDAPGMVMFQMSRAPGGPKAWVPLLRRRLQPNINTRVSAIGLFHSGHETNELGAEEVVHRATLLTNEHARFPQPDWVVSALGRFPEWKRPD